MPHRLNPFPFTVKPISGPEATLAVERTSRYDPEVERQTAAGVLPNISMNHIAIITPDIIGPVKNGGIGTACFHYARTLAETGMKVDILFTGFDIDPVEHQSWVEYYKKLNINFFDMSDAPDRGVQVYGSRWNSDRSWRAMTWLRARQPNYALFQEWQGNGFWSVRAKQMGLDFAQTTLGVIAHSSTEWQNEGMKSFGRVDIIYQSDVIWMEREAIAGADILISPSRHMVEWMRSHDFILPERVEICPYTFEDEERKSDLQRVDRTHLIFFGRLETRKGLHLFGAALRRLKAEDQRLPNKISLLGKFATVEGVPTEIYLNQLTADFPEVEFFIETGFDYLAAISYIAKSNAIVIIPSILDNLPLTVIESITNGFQFVAASTGGIPEMVDPRFLFSPSVAGLAQKLAELPHLNFKDAAHLYSPQNSRRIWLTHIRDVLRQEAESPKAPGRLSPLNVPPISVCIPFYRHDRYFRRLIGAFLKMDLPNLQLVIVDDGTPEDERQDFDRLAPDLRAMGHAVHFQPNAGPGAARNAALERADHDLLLFFDADNVPFPTMLTDLWRSMDKTGADSVAAPFIAVPPMLRTPRLSDGLYQFHPSGGPLGLALFENTVGDMTSLIRRQAFEDVGGFCTNITEPACEDWELFFRLIGRGYKHLVYPVPLVLYTAHPDREKSPSQKYDISASMFAQLDEIDKPALVKIAKTLAAHSLKLREGGAW